nr:[FeFe] hydrogenase H-cluster radical SAM maturase HydG [Deltaproteobacteria bacterium]
MKACKDFIDDNKIAALLNEAARPERARIEAIVAKAKELKGLDLAETAALLQTEDAELVALIRQAAREIKEAIYGNRLVLFAPLYIANHCSNDCLYC